MPVFSWNCLKVAVNLASSSLDKPCEMLTVVPLYCPFMALASSVPICDQSMVSQLTAGPDELPPAAVVGVVPAMASVAVAPGAEVSVAPAAGAAGVSVAAAAAGVFAAAAVVGAVVAAAGAVVGFSPPQAESSRLSIT